MITKLDLMDEGTDAREVLENKLLPLRRGENVQLPLFAVQKVAWMGWCWGVLEMDQRLCWTRCVLCSCSYLFSKHKGDCAKNILSGPEKSLPPLEYAA